MDLATHDSNILIRQGIVHLVRTIGGMAPEIIPGDDAYEFLARARVLLRRWKPWLLRDFTASRFRWCYLDHGCSRLLHVECSAEQTTHHYYSRARLSIESLDRALEDEWIDILGCNNQHALGISTDAPWLWP